MHLSANDSNRHLFRVSTISMGVGGQLITLNHTFVLYTYLLQLQVSIVPGRSRPETPRSYQGCDGSQYISLERNLSSSLYIRPGKSIRLVHGFPSAIGDLQPFFDIPILVHQAPLGLPFLRVCVEGLLPRFVVRFEPVNKCKGQQKINQKKNPIAKNKTR